MKLHSPIEKPYDKKIVITQGYHSNHHAIDIRNYDFDRRTNLRHCAMERSTIIAAGVGKRYKENYIILEGISGIEYLYCHNHLSKCFSIGDTVEAGQPFAISDLSGAGSTGYHLHLEMSVENQRLNPLDIMTASDKDFEWVMR